MLSAKDLQEVLQKTYFLRFDVVSEGGAIQIKPSDSKNNLFTIKANIKDGIRLSIECEPEKYAAAFVDTIAKAPFEKREVFCIYWYKLSENDKLAKLSVRIDDHEINQADFLSYDNDWKKFFVRYTKVFSSESENKEKFLQDKLVLFTAMILSLVEIEIEGFEEGSVTMTIHKQYERNPVNRQACLSVKGYKCSVCGKLLEDEYGEIAHEVIEVHHAVPVSTMGPGYVVDPIKDLFPVCPNCHTILHKRTPPYSIEEAKEMLRCAKDHED